jgi:transposase InsO family protein
LQETVQIMQSKETLFRNIYYNPKVPGSFGSLKRLQTAAKSTYKEAEQFLQSQDTHTRNRQFRFKFKRRKIMVPHVDYLWQADLVTVKNISGKNKGYEYLLTVIDVLSRFAFVEPIKKKTGKYVVEALKKIFSTSRRKPKYLQTDEGLEFFNFGKM